MTRLDAVLAVLLLVLLGFVHARLAAHERGGPPHEDLELATGAPATLYLPPAPVGARELPVEPPPGVVLVHGYGGDRAMMSTLARRLAQNGYAALAIDVRGHGASRERFPPGEPSPGRVFELQDDVDAALERLRDETRVDGLRLALLGHSMGSRTVLEVATRDSALDAVIVISGAAPLRGPFTPSNVLLLWASGDPPRNRSGMAELALRLGAPEPLVVGRSFGEFSPGTAVRAVEVEGHDHISILCPPGPRGRRSPGSTPRSASSGGPPRSSPTRASAGRSPASRSRRWRSSSLPGCWRGSRRPQGPPPPPRAYTAPPGRSSWGCSW